MASPIQNIFKNIPDEELKESIKEIMESDITGFVKSHGLITKYVDKIMEITHESSVSTSMHVQINLMKEASYRWAIKND